MSPAPLYHPNVSSTQVRRYTDAWDRTVEVERGQNVNTTMITISEADGDGRCRLARVIVDDFALRVLMQGIL